MTSKCKTCGHDESRHKKNKFYPEVPEGECLAFRGFKEACHCKKFQPKDEDVCHVEGCLGAPHHIIINQKKGSSEEKVWKDYLNHVKKKQKKPCCKLFGTDRLGMICGELCPSCSLLVDAGRNQTSRSNQSPHKSALRRNESNEDGSNLEGTSTLSDKMVECGEPYSLHTKDVREFIRRLKDEYCYCVEKIKPCRSCKFIDKLAGSKLLEGGSKNDR